MDFNFAHYMLTTRYEKDENRLCSPSKRLSREQLAQAFDMNRTRILAFKNKPPQPFQLTPQTKSVTKSQYIPEVSDKILDAPWVVDDFCLDLLVWSIGDVVAAP